MTRLETLTKGLIILDWFQERNQIFHPSIQMHYGGLFHAIMALLCLIVKEKLDLLQHKKQSKTTKYFIRNISIDMKQTIFIRIPNRSNIKLLKKQLIAWNFSFGKNVELTLGPQIQNTEIT